MQDPTFFQLPLMSNNEYSIRYVRTVGGKPTEVSVSIMDSSREDISKEIVEDYAAMYKHDPNFKVLSVSSEWFDLSTRIKCVRAMFELGHKVRAESKIRNRQPLRRAYILFADPKIQSFMQYIDCSKNEYATMFAKELNIFNVIFLEGSLDRFFTYALKPNFRVLGQKGMGKQAQQLKKDLAAMDDSSRATMLAALKTQTVEAFGMNLCLEDIEVEYLPKAGYMGATGKVGSIILDTTLDDGLIEHGTVADFKSCMQNVRKEANMNLLDRIEFDVYCSTKKMATLIKHLVKLKIELLADNVSFFAGGVLPSVTRPDVYRFALDGEEIGIVLRRTDELVEKVVVSDVRTSNEAVLGLFRSMQSVREDRSDEEHMKALMRRYGC